MFSPVAVVVAAGVLFIFLKIFMQANFCFSSIIQSFGDVLIFNRKDDFLASVCGAAHVNLMHAYTVQTAAPSGSIVHVVLDSCDVWCFSKLCTRQRDHVFRS